MRVSRLTKHCGRSVAETEAECRAANATCRELRPAGEARLRERGSLAVAAVFRAVRHGGARSSRGSRRLVGGKHFLHGSRRPRFGAAEDPGQSGCPAAATPPGPGTVARPGRVPRPRDGARPPESVVGALRGRVPILAALSAGGLVGPGSLTPRTRPGSEPRRASTGRRRHVVSRAGKPACGVGSGPGGWRAGLDPETHRLRLVLLRLAALTGS